MLSSPTGEKANRHIILLGYTAAERCTYTPYFVYKTRRLVYRPAGIRRACYIIAEPAADTAYTYFFAQMVSLGAGPAAAAYFGKTHTRNGKFSQPGR